MASRRRYLSRPLVLPRVRSFHELFSEWAPWEVGYPPTPSPIPAVRVPAEDTDRRGRRRRAFMEIGPFFRVYPLYHALAVRPSDRTLFALDRHTISIAYDTISFESIVWDLDGALTIAKHSQIIGETWLAVIDPLSIPNLFSPRATELALRAREERSGDAFAVLADVFEEEEQESFANLARQQAAREYRLGRRRSKGGTR